jgi:hypothetical protein
MGQNSGVTCVQCGAREDRSQPGEVRGRLGTEGWVLEVCHTSLQGQAGGSTRRSTDTSHQRPETLSSTSGSALAEGESP